MKFIIKVALVMGLVALSNHSFSQEFSSVEKLSSELNKIEVIFKEIKDVKTAELIISSIKEIEGVKDVELFFPHKKHAYIIMSSSTSSKIILDKLSEINVELEPKSLRN